MINCRLVIDIPMQVNRNLKSHFFHINNVNRPNYQNILNQVASLIIFSVCSINNSTPR